VQYPMDNSKLVIPIRRIANPVLPVAQLVTRICLRAWSQVIVYQLLVEKLVTFGSALVIFL